MWKTLSSQVLFKHQYLTVEEDEVELASGEKTHWLKYGDPERGAIIVPLDDKGNVLFVRQYSYVQNDIMLQLPMGRIDDAESLEQGADRELREETSLSAENLQLKGEFLQNHRRSKSVAYIFLATGLCHSPLPGDIEETIVETVWVPQNQLTDMISRGEILDNATLASLRICGL